MSLPTKARLLGLSVSENGLLWTMQMGAYYLSSGLAERAYAMASRRRVKHGLPGMNSPVMNKAIWDNWDWSAQGEEWSISPAWKDSVVRTLRQKSMVGPQHNEDGPKRSARQRLNRVPPAMSRQCSTAELRALQIRKGTVDPGYDRRA
jgi:hypothetical protein